MLMIEGGDAQNRDPLVELVDLQRQEDAGRDRREVLAPALHEPQAGGLDEVDRRVAEDGQATSSSVCGLVWSR